MSRLAVGSCLALLALFLSAFTPVAAAPANRDLSAQSRPPHIIIHPRHYLSPNAKRYCVSWLARETWPSGEKVITPQMHCWWQVPPTP